MVSSMTMKCFFFFFNTMTMIVLFEIKSTAVFNIYIFFDNMYLQKCFYCILYVY